MFHILFNDFYDDIFIFSCMKVSSHMYEIFFIFIQIYLFIYLYFYVQWHFFIFSCMKASSHIFMFIDFSDIFILVDFSDIPREKF